MPHTDPPPLDPTVAAGMQRRAALEQLGDRIAELSSRIQAATYDLLVLIREFDTGTGWTGWTSCAHWLSWRTGLAPGPAREHVRVARALGNLPKLSDAMRRGAVSYSKMRALTRVATPETEQVLLDVAQCGTAAHVERIVRGWRRVDRMEERTEERRRQEKRSLRTWVDEDGMVVVRGRLTPEVGAVLRRALEAACDQTWRKENDTADDRADVTASDVALAEEELGVSPAQRRADAIGVLAECALAGGLDRGTAGDRYQVVLHVDGGALAEASDVPAGTSPGTAISSEVASGDDAHVPAGTLRATVNASASGDGDDQGYVPAGTPAGGGPQLRRSPQPCPGPARAVASPAATSESALCSQTVLDEAGGLHVSAETARRLACDSATVEMRHGAVGEILDVGRRRRTISPALRRALASRDGQCRFPACSNTRCDAHHVRHWADGGRTALDNLVLLCRRHHRAVHEEGFRIALDAAGDVHFTRPDGRPFPAALPSPQWTGAPLAPTDDRLVREGVTIDAQTAAPTWSGERLDLGWTVSVLRRPQPDGPDG